jgi:hypothetical protein
MTPRTSLIVTVVGAALAVAAPAAWGDNSQGVRQGPGNLAVSPEIYASTTSSTTMARQGPGNLAISPEVYERIVLGRNAQMRSGAVQSYPDVVDRAVAARNTAGRNLVFDNYRVDPRAQAPSPTQLVVSKSDGWIDWPQIGIGIGFGLVFALGLGLALRFAHIRPLAH